MARKKIVFVIVEGPSEEDAVGAVLNRVFDTNLVHLEVCHCDLTSKRGTTADNICSRVCQVVKDYAKENRFKSEDFQQIIHLIDTHRHHRVGIILLFRDTPSHPLRDKFSRPEFVS